MSRQQFFFALTLFIVLFVAACAPATPPTPTPAAVPTVAAGPTTVSITVTDVAGRKVTLAAIPQRIISLAPSDTEILFALDLGSQVVGVDDFSDFPAAAKSLPKIGGSGGKYNFEQIVSLKPDLILAAGITAPEVIKKLEDFKLNVLIVSATKTTFESIFNSIALVGAATGRVAQAKRVTDAMQQKLDAIKAKMAAGKTKPRVYWELDATNPAKPFTVGPGSFIDDIIILAGGVNVFGTVSNSYPQVGAEQVVAANPEVIILSDVAYGITVDSVLNRSGWQVIEAVKKKQVYPIDDNLVSRPGPRIVDGLEAAAKLIHPEVFK